MLYHLDTGETEDFLADTAAGNLEYTYSYLWSEDMNKALILCSSGPDGQQWQFPCRQRWNTLNTVFFIRTDDDEIRLTTWQKEFAG